MITVTQTIHVLRVKEYVRNKYNGKTYIAKVKKRTVSVFWIPVFTSIIQIIE